MAEKKVLRFRKKVPDEPEAGIELSTEQKLEQLRNENEQNIVQSNKPVIMPNKPVVKQNASPVQQVDKSVVEESIKPRDVSAEIAALIRAYKGDLLKVQQFIIEHFDDPEDLYTAGFQMCLILTNDRLAKENALRDIFENMRRGTITVPFDPREDPLFLKLIKQIIPSQVPRQVLEQVPAKIPIKVPTKEDYTTQREQELAEIHAMLDGPTGGAQ